MKRLIICAVVLIVNINAFSQAPLPLMPNMEIPEHVKRQKQRESQQRTTPARNITVEVSGVNRITAVFYYSPRMENEDYSYRKELGSDNNFLDFI